MQNHQKPIFALANWTAEQRRDGWYYGNTYGERKFRGPYSSATSVALMIAREITKEITRRQERMKPQPVE